MSDDHVSCLPRARARDTGAFPLPLAALLALRLPASVSRAGGALGSVVPRAPPIGQAPNQLVPSCNFFLRRSF